jgi:hypothetical protein
MQKATTNDIAAVCSRIDAQTVILIELYTGCNKPLGKKYRKRYDELAAKFRKGMVDF